MMLTRICRRAAPWLAFCAAMALLPAHSQTPGTAPPAGGAGEHGPQRPPLFFREEWKDRKSVV